MGVTTSEEDKGNDDLDRKDTKATFKHKVRYTETCNSDSKFARTTHYGKVNQSSTI